MSFYQLSKVLVNITGSARATILHHFLAGLGVGVIESLILTPFEVVKISIMSDQLRIVCTSNIATLRRLLSDT